MHFRKGLTQSGFRIIKSTYPVVPKGFARISSHVTIHQTYDQLDQVIEVIKAASKK